MFNKDNMKFFLIGVMTGVIFFSNIVIAAVTKIDVHFLPIKYFFEGIEKVPAGGLKGFIYNGSTYVPLRFLSEQLGKEVTWDGNTYSIYIGKVPNIKYLEDVESYDTHIGTFLSVITDFVTANGDSYKHGYKGMSYTEVSRFTYIVGKYKRFEATLSPSKYFIQSKTSFSNIGQFKVYCDNLLVYDSGFIPSNSEPIKVNIDLTNKRDMTIEFRGFELGLLNPIMVETF